MLPDREELCFVQGSVRYHCPARGEPEVHQVGHLQGVGRGGKTSRPGEDRPHTEYLVRVETGTVFNINTHIHTYIWYACGGGGVRARVFYTHIYIYIYT